jgi:hypothetical protein
MFSKLLKICDLKTNNNNTGRHPIEYPLLPLLGVESEFRSRARVHEGRRCFCRTEIQSCDQTGRRIGEVKEALVGDVIIVVQTPDEEFDILT